MSGVYHGETLNGSFGRLMCCFPIITFLYVQFDCSYYQKLLYIVPSLNIHFCLISASIFVHLLSVVYPPDQCRMNLMTLYIRRYRTAELEIDVSTVRQERKQEHCFVQAIIMI